VQFDKLQFKIEAAREKHNLLLDALKQLTHTKNAEITKRNNQIQLSPTHYDD